jgi:hypothetical protein
MAFRSRAWFPCTRWVLMASMHSRVHHGSFARSGEQLHSHLVIRGGALEMHLVMFCMYCRMDSAQRQQVVSSIHRSMVFLGDLSRYIELQNNHTPKLFVDARNYYLKALQLNPDYGSPHNQVCSHCSSFMLVCLIVAHTYVRT